MDLLACRFSGRCGRGFHRGLTIGLTQLYAVAFLSGAGTIFFAVAYPAFLPSLLPADRLIEANSKLRGSSAVAEIAGPGLGGLLVQLLTAPFTLAINALSFLVSIGSMLQIRSAEVSPPGAALDVGSELAAGMRKVWHDPLLRPAPWRPPSAHCFPQ